MYINKKDLLLYESREDRIPSVGLRKLNLLGYNDNNNNYNSPNKSVLKKGLSNKKLLSNIKSPKTLYHPKNINSPIIPSFSFSFSQSKGSKFSPMDKTYIQRFKQNSFSKNLLLPRNMKPYTPKIKSMKKTIKSAILNISEKYNSGKIMKSSFSNNRMTNDSSNINFNFNMNGTSGSFKSNLNLLIYKNDNEYNDNISKEKSMFKLKLKRKLLNEESKGNIIFKYRKKYPFVRASELMLAEKEKIIPESISKINKKFYLLLLKENVSIFQHPMSIIEKGKLSKKFENPKDCEIKKRKPVEIKDFHIGEYILKEEEIKLKQEKEKKKLDRRSILYKFKKKMKDIYLIKKNLNIPMSEIIKEYKISNCIFNFSKTRYLNYFIKIKDFTNALDILSSNHNLVLDVDQFYMTPLHYAVKYNNYQIIPHLMGYGAYVEAKNSFGITPLIIAMERNFYESIILLFLYMANPFIKNKSKDFYTKNIFERVKNIHLSNMNPKCLNFDEKVKNDIYIFAMNECKSLIESECYSIIKEKFKYK